MPRNWALRKMPRYWALRKMYSKHRELHKHAQGRSCPHVAMHVAENTQGRERNRARRPLADGQCWGFGAGTDTRGRSGGAVVSLQWCWQRARFGEDRFGQATNRVRSSADRKRIRRLSQTRLLQKCGVGHWFGLAWRLRALCRHWCVVILGV